jgi:thiol-disulfide isomerase/thioredoxin
MPQAAAAACCRLEAGQLRVHMSAMSASTSPAPRRLPPSVAILVLCAVLGGAAAWFGLSGAGGGKAVAEECRAALPTAERIAPKARGEVAALSVAGSPAVAPDIAFKGPGGEDLSLKDFKGRTVLVNLWATWCLPCREEMPALDRLQAELGGADFEVVAINVDTRNPEKPKAWLGENGIRNLAYYAEPGGTLLQVLQRSGHVIGLPTTLLIDRTGCEIGILKGPAAWAAPDALALVRAALQP